MSMNQGTAAAPLDDLVAQVTDLPSDWHGAGSLSREVLAAIARHASQRPVRHSVETGTGKSTLVLSHCSPSHTVFAQDDRGRGDSLMRVQSSPLLRRDAVSFVVGPTQRTLPPFAFQHPLDLAMLDGPHGYPFPELEYYFIYQHLAEGARLIVDDINIPNVYHMFCVLRDDEMYRLEEVVHTTAFFVRTSAPLFDPEADGWWLQRYNKRRFPVRDDMLPSSALDHVKRFVPEPAKAFVRKMRAARSRSRRP
jgi:hypothetical protein